MLLCLFRLPSWLAAAAAVLRRAGCRVGVVSGMLDGLNALRRRQFGLILIDVRVVALAGSGLSGDGERHRELGSNDHLSKPFRRSEVRVMLSKQLPSPAPGGLNDALVQVHADEPVLDPLALARLGELDPTGENRLLQRVLQAFQTSVARLRPQFDAARRDLDHTAIRLVVHTLKSSSASIGALRLSQLCAQVESAIRLETGEDLSGPLQALDAALDSVLAAIGKRLEERV